MRQTLGSAKKAAIALRTGYEKKINELTSALDGKAAAIYQDTVRTEIKWEKYLKQNGNTVAVAIPMKLTCLPYAANGKAKAEGAIYDPTTKSWFVPPNTLLRPFIEWL